MLNLINTVVNLPYTIVNRSMVIVNRCTCQRCVAMPSALESRCCKESPKITDKVDQWNEEQREQHSEEEEHVDIACITDHPGFHTGCLDRYTLEIAYLQYKQQYGGLRKSVHE